MQKTVMVAGKVITATDSTLILESGEDKKITVYRSKPFLVLVEVGMNVLIRGTVNPDLSIVESKDFPPSDIGERFGMLFFLTFIDTVFRAIENDRATDCYQFTLFSIICL